MPLGLLKFRVPPRSSLGYVLSCASAPSKRRRRSLEFEADAVFLGSVLELGMVHAFLCDDHAVRAICRGLVDELGHDVAA